MYTIRTLPSPVVPSTVYCTLCHAANHAMLSSTPATVAVLYCATLQLQQRQRSLSAAVLNGGAAAATDRAPAHWPSCLHMHALLPLTQFAVWLFLQPPVTERWCPWATSRAKVGALQVQPPPSGIGCCKYGRCGLSGRLTQYNSQQYSPAVLVVGRCCS